MPKVVASIEARMGSSRLPGKVLKEINGRPAIECLALRLQQAQSLDAVVLATSLSPKDDVLAQWAQSYGMPVVRGSEEDVLGRVIEAQRAMDADIVVEVTGDCILLDPTIIDMGVETFFGNDCDVVTNVRKASFPLGMDVQVFRLDDLVQVGEKVDDPAVREHVSLYFYEHPEIFRVMHLFAPSRWRWPELRTMLDYPEDLDFIRAVYERLEPRLGPCFELEDLMVLLQDEPQLAEINIHCHRTTPR